MKKISLILFFVFLCLPITYAENPKYVFLFIGDGMSMSSEVALSLFWHGQDKMLFWNKFPVQTYMTTWSKSSYREIYDKNNFDPEKGYDTKIAGTLPYPYYKTDESEQYFKKPFATDSAAAATAMATGEKVYNKTICCDKQSNKSISNIVDKINEKKKYNTALITTDKFYSATPAGFFSHNINRKNYKEIAAEILSKTKPEIIIGKNKLDEMNSFAALNGYYLMDASEINKPQVFDLVNKKLFIKLQRYLVPQPVENFSNEPFEYVSETNKFSDIVLNTTKLLLEKKKPFFALVEVCDIDKANHKGMYNKMLGAMYEFNETVKAVYELIDSKSTDMTFDNTVIIVTADHSTGMLRFNEYPGKGELPVTYTVKKDSTTITTNKKISYKTDWHTNELVGCYCVGAKSDVIKECINKQNIIDNTDIYNILNDVIFNDN